MMKKILAALFFFALSVQAFAQTSPNLIQGQVLTPAQWNQLFINKQDTLGYIPLNIAGGMMSGPLVTAAPGASVAGLNLTPGSTPGTPNNGDIWVTSSSIYAQVNGVTYDLIGSPCTNCALTNVANVFTSALQTVEGLTTTSPGWYAQITGDTAPRVRVGLNATDMASVAFGSGSTNRDTFIERAGAANIRLGAPDAASPVAQILSVQNVVAGTSNGAGAALNINGSQGTGTGNGGQIVFNVSVPGSSGSTQNALVPAMRIAGSDGSLSIGSCGGAPGAGNVNLCGSLLYANSTAPTGSGGGYVRATGPTISSLIVTTAFTATGLVTDADLVTGTQDTALGYWGSTTASAIAVNNCANSLTYSTSTHTFGCNSGAGTGSVTSVGLTAGTGITLGGAGPNPIIATGNITITNAGVVSIASNTGAFTLGGLLTNSTNLLQVVAASKGDQQTGTSATLAVTPLHQQDHDSAAKVWAYFGSSGTVSGSYGVSTVGHPSTGQYTVNFSTAFASANYACTVTTDNGTAVVGYITSKVVGSFNIETFNSTFTVIDSAADVVCYGRQ